MTKKFWISFTSVLIVLLFLGIGFFLFSPKNKSSEPKIIINNQEILVEIMDTQEKRAQGLSGREKMAENRGMLFIFDRAAFYTFWMKDMKFNLDFVYINNDKIVDLVEDVPYPKAGEQPITISSKFPFDKILEVNSGTIKKFDFQIGQNATLLID